MKRVGSARALRGALLVAALLAPLAAGAVQPDEMLADVGLEARARALSSELRCLVCQNQSIDDSDAGLARDLRLLVRERLRAGDSDAAVKELLTARYGDFILLRPPLKPGTLLLWLTPTLVLLLGGVGLARALRGRKGRELDGEELTEDEARRLAELGGEGEPAISSARRNVG